MLSTMQDRPLTIAALFAHGRTIHGSSEVVTCEGERVRRARFTEVAARAERLAAALRRLGIRPGDRVATFSVQITDRAKDVIKSGGEWISSVELENAIMAHPDVLEAAVVGVPDPRWDERPLACVVPRPGARPNADVLKAFLAERVARWWVPERWSFIDEVPKTSVGKFDKKLLRARYAEGALTVVEEPAARTAR